MKLLVAIPAYNEAAAVGDVIKKTAAVVPDADIVVIDDGSTDGTAAAAAAQGIRVIRHRMNRGLGGAIGTALLWAKRHQYDVMVTIDADGQHDPVDILKAIKPVVHDKADLVIGSRSALLEEMPWDRKVINSIANFVTFLLFGVVTFDSQSGFRVFGKKAIDHLTLRTDRMEVSSEVFAEVKRLNLRFTEIPITVIYSEYSRAKGQKNSNSFPILFRLILRLFR